MEITPEIVDSVAKLVIGSIAAVGGIVSTATAFFTWKTRYELDRLYATTYRPNGDGTPGPMRKHPDVMVKLFTRAHPDKPKSPIEGTAETSSQGGPADEVPPQ